MIRKVSLIALMALAVLFPLAALDLSLEDAISLAAEQNLSLKNARITLETAKNDYKYSYNNLLPDITASATFSHANENASVAVQNKLEGRSVPDPTWAFTYGISGTWTFNPALITNIQIAKEKYAEGEITYEEAARKLSQNVAKAYYGIILQEEKLKIQAETMKNQEARYAQAKRDYDGGYVPEISLLQSEVAYRNAIPAYQEAERSVKTSKRQFALLLGLDVNEELVLTTGIDAAMVDVDASEALSSIGKRYDIRLLDSQEKQLKLQKTALVESTFIPSVRLAMSWQPYLYDLDKSGSKYWVDTGSFSGTVAWNLTDILPTSDGWSNLKSVKNGLEQIRQGRALAEDAARIEILNLVDTLDQTRMSLESAESTVALAEASYNMRQASYNEGTTDYLDLIDSQTALNQARLAKLSNQYNYISALIDLEYATMQSYIK